jgi:hypothetical protein
VAGSHRSEELDPDRSKEVRKIAMNDSTVPSRACRPGLMGPVILIALGVLFLLHELVPGWGLGKTWPVILVLVGVLRLVDMSRPPRPPEGPRV